HLSNITVDGADQAVFIDALPHVPLHDVDFNNVTIHANQGFTSINADDVKLTNVIITASSGPVYTLVNSTNFLFDHVLCPVGADPFLHLEGNSSGISLKDTDTTPAKTAFVLDQGIAQDAIKIWDNVPPVTAAQISPSSPDGQNNWYVHPVTVTLSATDDRSGVDSTVYSINGGAWQTYNGPVTINNDGSYTIAYYSTDKEGNAEEAKNLSFQIDQTAPAISYSGNAGVYTIDENVNISCNAGDSLSGVANSTCADISGPAYSFKLGNNAYSAQATDLAGNSSKGTTEFTVKVTYNSLINLTKKFVTDSGVANSLTAKLDAAIQSERRGNTNAMDNQLDAYVNEISAQSGKALTNEQANLLSQFAKELN
ncbi:MAG: OmpL47-type beta-barrel domain-containing protein, partial [Bacillus sp. (in: firmicutes)]